jgi:hypothetical protein
VERPSAPEKPDPVDTEWAKTRLSIRDLAHYLLLEAKASTLGIYIHPDGVLANAKDDQGQPCTKYLKFDREKGRPLTYSQNPRSGPIVRVSTLTRCTTRITAGSRAIEPGKRN